MMKFPISGQFLLTIITNIVINASLKIQNISERFNIDGALNKPHVHVLYLSCKQKLYTIILKTTSTNLKIVNVILKV